MKTGAVIFSCLTVLLFATREEATPSVSMNTDEAEAVLSILTKKAGGAEVSEADWNRLMTSEPYVRLKAREEAMKRDFTDAEFREFVLSEELAMRASDLRRALDVWSSVDLGVPLARAAAYLPEGRSIGARIYPVIKPKTNSFVFDISSDPAIFIYLDPSVTLEKLSNTLAHELHHIGFGSRCPAAATEDAIAAIPGDLGWLVPRLAAFGEGFAMLAAAGGADVHPHSDSKAEERERWDRDVARAPDDFRKVGEFILNVVDGSLSGDARQQAFFSFYGEQGPWYTIGWVMASTIEKELGRDALLEAFCDTRALLPMYNRAARARNDQSDEKVPLWSDDVIRAVAGERVGSGE